MSLNKYKAFLLKHYGLSKIPFQPVPPDDLTEVAKVFHGRKEILDRSIINLYEGRNIMIRGGWGIGKSALIKAMLVQLQQEVNELKEEMLIIYIGGIPEMTIANFYRTLLLGITQQLSANSIEAKAIADSLGGSNLQASKNKLEGGVNLFVMTVKASREPNSVDLKDGMIYQQLLFWLDQATEIYGRVVIAIDDLDKPDSPIVQQILENSLDLFRQGSQRSFIMTGRRLTDLQDATIRALGIFSEDIRLGPMSPADLRQIVINYLNSVRATPSSSCHPFTDSVLDQVVEYAQGIPRQLNLICANLLREAAQKEFITIDDQSLQTLWPIIQEQILPNLTPQLRHLLYVIYELGGIDEDLSNNDLDRLEVLTFSELLPALNELQNKDLLIRGTGELKSRFLPSKIVPPPPAGS
jgi:type II secretory pathway predicted ATPase ExeA